jgi:hypothetical protein
MSRGTCRRLRTDLYGSEMPREIRAPQYCPWYPADYRYIDRCLLYSRNVYRRDAGPICLGYT